MVLHPPAEVYTAGDEPHTGWIVKDIAEEWTFFRVYVSSHSRMNLSRHIQWKFSPPPAAIQGIISVYFKTTSTVLS